MPFQAYTKCLYRHLTHLVPNSQYIFSQQPQLGSHINKYQKQSQHHWQIQRTSSPPLSLLILFSCPSPSFFPPPLLWFLLPIILFHHTWVFAFILTLLMFFVLFSSLPPFLAMGSSKNQIRLFYICIGCFELSVLYLESGCNMKPRRERESWKEFPLQ